MKDISYLRVNSQNNIFFTYIINPGIYIASFVNICDIRGSKTKKYEKDFNCWWCEWDWALNGACLGRKI